MLAFIVVFLADCFSYSVNKLKGTANHERAWDDASEFDAEKDKTQFRNYEDACDRVKNFYKEQHGDSLPVYQ